MDKAEISFTDSHCHLNHPNFRFRLPETLAAAEKAGVRRIFSVCAECADWQPVQDSAQQFAQIVPVCGIHPLFIHTLPENALTDLEKMLRENPQIIIGEIGLDFYAAASRTESTRKNQEEIFRAQLDIARQYRRPIVLHQRRATARCLEILHESGIEKGIAHAFSGSLESARAFLNQGFLIGIGTLLLRSNSLKLKEIMRFLPADGFVWESDAPFMQAQNHPAMTAAIARAAAAIRQTSPEETARAAEENIGKFLSFHAV